MSQLGYIHEEKVVTCFTKEEIKKIRDSALTLTYQNFHPRYELPIQDLFKAADAILMHMEADDAKSVNMDNITAPND